MKKLTVGILLCFAALAFLLVSCEGPIMSLTDDPIAFDASGHVKTDVTYTTTGGTSVYTETFSTDGTYEYVQKSWDAASSSWMQSGGIRGTYSYDTGTRTMTNNFTAGWTGGTGGSYVNFTAATVGVPKTQTMQIILGSSNWYQVIVGGDGSYNTSGRITYWDDSYETQSMSITIANDLLSSTMVQEGELYLAGGTAVDGYKDEVVNTFSQIFPSGITSLDKAKGKYITLISLKAVTTPYTWVSGTTFTAGTAVTDNSPMTSTISFASDGSYIAMISSYNLSRNLISK